MSTRLSVVVPTRNRREALGRMLVAVQADGAVDEIVVVDDGSTDDTAAFLAEVAAVDPRVRRVEGPARGAGWARQAGAETATGDLLLMLDDDVIPRPGLGAGHLRAHEEHERAVVVGYMPTTPPTGGGVDAVPARIYAKDYEAQIALYEDDPSTVLSDLWAGNVSMKRSDALAVGLVTADSVLYHEDKDFGLRCLASGMRGVFVRDLAADHFPIRTFDAFVRLARAWGHDLEIVHRRHAPVIGHLDLAGIGAELPWLLRAAVRASDARPVAALELRMLPRLVAILDRPRWRRAQNGAAVLARAIATRQGAREARREAAAEAAVS